MLDSLRSRVDANTAELTLTTIIVHTFKTPGECCKAIAEYSTQNRKTKYLSIEKLSENETQFTTVYKFDNEAELHTATRIATNNLTAARLELLVGFDSTQDDPDEAFQKIIENKEKVIEFLKVV